MLLPTKLQALGPVVQRLIQRRKEQADREHDVETFRYLHAFSVALLSNTGVEVPREPREEWMAVVRAQ